MVTIEEKLALVRYNVDAESHIQVDAVVCRTCPHHACTFVCPAACYVLRAPSDLVFSDAGCLECGTCRVICDLGAIQWRYPRGGFGVSYRFT